MTRCTKLDELRQRLVRYLDARQTAVLSAWGCWGRPWALPVQNRRRGLEIECLLPRWADIVSHLDEASEVLLIVRDEYKGTARWLKYRGQAGLVESPNWTVWNLPFEYESSPEYRYAVCSTSPRNGST